MDTLTIPSPSRPDSLRPEDHLTPHPIPFSVGEPSAEDIARLAYTLYLNGGRQSGRGEQNWRQAELSLAQGA